MGKFEQQQRNHDPEAPDSSGIVCNRCYTFFSTFSFKCFFILFFSLSALFCSLFWILPKQTVNLSFDAKDEIKQSATVQASFRLEKPVSQLIPHIERLEYDIYCEIGLPRTKVSVLSLHQSVAPNWTDVVVGVLSDPVNVSIYPASVNLLRSSLIELYFQQSNLMLTTSLFGNASTFQTLKIPGGITVIPLQFASIWQKPEVLFNFTLDNSISGILDNFTAFKEELKVGLHLKKLDESVYMLLTNGNGSTLNPPVTVQASVMSGFGGLLPQRLKQLAKTIRNSSAKNLGLNHSSFGKVKNIRLSSLLSDNTHATSPSPSPAPSPRFSDQPSVSPYRAPSYSPIPAPSIVTAHPPNYSGSVYRSSPSLKSYSPPVAAPTSHSSGHTIAEAPDPSEGISAPSSLSSAGDDFHHREILLLESFLHDVTFR